MCVAECPSKKIILGPEDRHVRLWKAKGPKLGTPRSCGFATLHCQLLSGLKSSRFTALWLILLLSTCAFSLAAQPKAPLRPPLQINRPEALVQGTQLVQDLLSRVPESSSRTNTLRIRDASGRQREFPVRFEIQVTSSNWSSTYETLPSPQTPTLAKLVVLSQPNGPNEYRLTQAPERGLQSAATPADSAASPADRKLQGNETMAPFADSDFWVSDLGLEFLRWPEQLLLRKELRKGQSCSVLESVNPAKAPGAYSKVVSWIDIDTGGIVHADAYDQDGKIFKQFDPSELQKVEGRMQVKEIEIRNRKTGSRSWVTFDLK